MGITSGRLPRRASALGWAMLASALIAGASLFVLQQVWGASVTPILVTETRNIPCQELADRYATGETWLELKVDPNPEGAGPFNFSDGTLTVTITNATDDGFDWSSNIGVDAVFVKGGAGGSNLYLYDPPSESTGDTGLVIPNADTNGISHISFCYDIGLVAEKTAMATFTRTYTWEITKSVEPASHVGFTGDSFTSDYTVTVDQTVTDSAFAVSGTITVTNPAPISVSFSVTDSVDGTNATVNCPTDELAPGASTECTYSASLTGPTDGTNTATITSLTAGVDGTTASADYAFGDPTTTVGFPTINVTDSVAGPLGSASGDDTFEYSDTFTCDEDEGTHPNTATIVETEQTASAEVEVTCYALTVTKDADPAFDREWTWEIVKSADQTELLLAAGQLFTVNYEVMVSATASDGGHRVSGTISVHNPAPIEATIDEVTDELTGEIDADVDCGELFPIVIPAGGTLECDYSADLPDATDRTNTATATLRNRPSGTTDFVGTADVSFAEGDLEDETDECVEVTDTNQADALGTVCAGDAPETFTYSLTFGAHPDADVLLECGENTHINTASFETNDTGATGDDGHTVTATVACQTGCTLTQGYWKTHSHRGPAPADDAWFAIGDVDGDGTSEGADETFFDSGKTWYQVLWMPPAGGNAYLQLAHQYIAAALNVANGASTSAAVDAALAGAEAWFPGKTISGSISNPDKAMLRGWAGTLDRFNNGLFGPGHCSEE